MLSVCAKCDFQLREVEVKVHIESHHTENRPLAISQQFTKFVSWIDFPSGQSLPFDRAQDGCLMEVYTLLSAVSSYN